MMSPKSFISPDRVFNLFSASPAENVTPLFAVCVKFSRARGSRGGHC